MIITLVFLSVLAQSQIVKGKLSNKNSDPIPFATILLLKASDTTMVKADVSDSTGFFQTTLPNSDTSYFIEIQTMNYKSLFTKPFKGDKNFNQIILETDNKIKEVELTFQKPMFEVTGRGMIVNVEGSPILSSGNTQEVLEKVPGMVVNQDGSLTLKGKPNIMIYMDGKPTNMNQQDLVILLKNTPASEIEKIEVFVNSMVSKKTDVSTRLMTPDEAVENGALALFGEKYGDEVRVLSMGDENGKYFSTELCGGTHVKNTGDIGKFKIISQSSIAAGIRRIEALRDKQLDDYLNNKEKLSNLSSEKNDEVIKDLTKQIIKLGGKPSLDELDQKILIKNLNKQLETLLVKSILSDKRKNKIKDEEIKGIKIRFQNVEGLPTKELRKLVDDGKKALGQGIVVVFASKDDKVGVAVGVTNELTEKYDAVNFVKQSSKIIGGQGGGGRKDFAQAGGQYANKINEAFNKIRNLI